MDESVRARIFEPFFTTKSVGRGMGLPAALGVARGHNGGIEIVSAPGRGSTFRVLFPALGAVTALGPTILVVDDEELVIRVIDLALQRAGYRTILARTGDEAVRLFEAARERIGAVILDLRLPGMSGGEVLAKICQADPAVKVLISTAYDEKRALELVRGFGYSGFLQKPYTASTLLEKVEEVLAAPAAAAGAGQ
jgi:CheY-like chemotaxis protein